MEKLIFTENQEGNEGYCDRIMRGFHAGCVKLTQRWRLHKSGNGMRKWKNLTNSRAELGAGCWQPGCLLLRRN